MNFKEYLSVKFSRTGSKQETQPRQVTHIDGLKLVHPEGYLAREEFEGLGFRHLADLSENRWLCETAQGKKAVVLYQSIPTFDFEDRRWDSYRKLYLLPEKGKVRGYWVSGGYEVARVRCYPEVLWGNEETRRWMEQTGVFCLGKENDP